MPTNPNEDVYGFDTRIILSTFEVQWDNGEEVEGADAANNPTEVCTFRGECFLFDSKLGLHAIFWEQRALSLFRSVFAFGRKRHVSAAIGSFCSLNFSHFVKFYLERATLTRELAQENKQTFKDVMDSIMTLARMKAK